MPRLRSLCSFALVGLLVLPACSGDDDDGDAASADSEWCDSVDEATISKILGGEPDPSPVAASNDVGDGAGCDWTHTTISSVSHLAVVVTTYTSVEIAETYMQNQFSAFGQDNTADVGEEAVLASGALGITLHARKGQVVVTVGTASAVLQGDELINELVAIGRDVIETV